MLVIIVIGMFGLGFGLAPLYGMLCRITGIQTLPAIAETVSIAPLQELPVENSRQVIIKFDTTVSAGLPWEFRPLVRSLTVYPGTINEARFHARNLSEDTITGQAIPSIVPWQGTEYFNKIECFCFRKQVLKSQESREMLLQFVISPDLPPGINSLILSYTFMNNDAASAEKYRVWTPQQPSDNSGPAETDATLVLPESAYAKVNTRDSY